MILYRVIVLHQNPETNIFKDYNKITDDLMNSWPTTESIG